MSNFSGFTSSFINSIPSIGYDLMSSIQTSTVTISNTNYSIGYMYLGELLIQFSIDSFPSSSGGRTVNFPVAFKTCYGILVTNNQNNSDIATSSFNNSSFTYVNSGNNMTWLAYGSF